MTNLHSHLEMIFICAARDSSNPVAVKKIIELLVDKQNNLPPELRLLPHYYQFIYATQALFTSYHKMELTEMGDWIGLALSDDPKSSHTKIFHLDRLVNFFQSKELTSWEGFTPTMVKFFGAFYFYARERTAMNDIAIELWAYAESIFDVVISSLDEDIDIDGAELGIHMACWAAKEAPGLASNFVPHLEDLAINGTMPKIIQASLHQCLSTKAGEFSSKAPHVWSGITYTKFGETLPKQFIIQLLATIYANDPAGDSSELLRQIDITQSSIKRKFSDIEFFRNAAMRTASIQPFIVKALNNGDAHLALHGLLLWYQLLNETENISAEELYISIPFGEEGYLAVMGDQKKFISRDSQAYLERVVRSANKFLGVAKTVAFADNSDLSIPDRIGIPEYSHSEEYESALINGYCFSAFPFHSKPSCQLIIDDECTPIQAIQLSIWNETWPITSSLSIPKPDREPKKILIWCGGGSLTEESETEVVKNIFESAGSLVDVVPFSAATKHGFLEAYQDPSYDVIWVASHGEFDHWNPKNVTMHIGNELSVSLESLWGEAPAADKRRLLFLNICDGARFEERGFLPKIGLAPGLARTDQATISHLWPVMGYPAAAFGAYLAHSLANGAPYFESYKTAVLAIRGATTDIAADLSSKIGDEFAIIRQLRMRYEDYSPLEFYGSAAFYQ